jgi:hypothetical protein
MTFSALLANLSEQPGWQAFHQELMLKVDEDSHFTLRHKAGRVVALTYWVKNDVVAMWAVDRLADTHVRELEHLKESALRQAADLFVPSDLKEKLKCT